MSENVTITEIQIPFSLRFVLDVPGSIRPTILTQD